MKRRIFLKFLTATVSIFATSCAMSKRMPNRCKKPKNYRTISNIRRLSDVCSFNF